MGLAVIVMDGTDIASNGVSGAELLLNLLNTAPVVRGVRQDVLSGPDAHVWLRAHGGSGTDAELSATAAARDRLQEVLRGGEAAAALSPLLEGVRSEPRIEPSGVVWKLVVEPPRRIAVGAVLAWAHLQRSRPGRLRPCENPDCARFLLDQSKANTARWCSMAVCGNRMKARRHQQRRQG